jgi:hypothetical protein
VTPRAMLLESLGRRLALAARPRANPDGSREVGDAS